MNESTKNDKPKMTYATNIVGNGMLEPIFPLEKQFNWLVEKLISISTILLSLMIIPITLDILFRTFIAGSLWGVLEIETMGLVVIGFFAMAFPIMLRQQIQVDLFFVKFSHNIQVRIALFNMLTGVVVFALLSWYAYQAAFRVTQLLSMLQLPLTYFILVTAFGFAMVALGSFFQLLHLIRERVKAKDLLWIPIIFILVALIMYSPFAYKASGLNLSTLTVGSIGFCALLFFLMIRMPMGVAMGAIGILGMMALMRSPQAVATAVGQVPFRQSAEFVLLAIPMFMFMGEMIAVAGLSKDLFDCAQKWFGKLPGGLAVAAVGGCAGFGAVCGDSMATVATMSSVAMEPMRKAGYAGSLSAGSLAAGGTLGILIPPSMGFIMYSIMTEESVGKLFLAGFLPGILLTVIFMLIIVVQVKRDPSLAPISDTYSLKEKLLSLFSLIPIIVLFVIVVGGIMTGMFTPGEGGAIGAFFSIIYAAIRGKLTIKDLLFRVRKVAMLCGVIFAILVGVFTFGVFLTSSRLPALMADFVTHMEVNKYLILLFILSIYIILGCVMNVMPMMMLTLPSIYPTIQALGFDGIWFGVITVIVMEMGLITPPVGLNVFTMATAAPEVPLSTIYRGVMPFFFGMCACTVILCIFPIIATFLPSVFM